MIAGDITGVSVQDFPRRVRKRVPDGKPFSALQPGAFDLIAGRGASPSEVLWKLEHGYFPVALENLP
jgi:hypothetical protein